MQLEKMVEQAEEWADKIEWIALNLNFHISTYLPTMSSIFCNSSLTSAISTMSSAYSNAPHQTPDTFTPKLSLSNSSTIPIMYKLYKSGDRGEPCMHACIRQCFVNVALSSRWYTVRLVPRSTKPAAPSCLVGRESLGIKTKLLQTKFMRIPWVIGHIVNTRHNNQKLP